MPSIDSDVLPGFSPDDVQFVAIHCYPEGGNAAFHTQWFGLSFPLALDFDSELFRRFRLPGHVYPLHVVVDRQGRVAYVGAPLEDAVAAVQGLLAE